MGAPPEDPEPGDLVVLVRPRGNADQRYPNVWRGDRLAVLATHEKVVRALRRAGAGRVFFQLSPGSRIVGSAEVGAIEGGGDAYRVTLERWQAMDRGPAGRSYGTSWYWVK